MTASIQFRRVHHISRETANVRAALAFYRDVMGFEQIWRPNFRFDGAWLYRNGVQIHLIAGDPPPRDATIESTADHIAFYVDDIDDAEERLKEHNVAYIRNHVPQTNVTQLFFHDPDGNHIELGTYPPERPLPPGG